MFKLVNLPKYAKWIQEKYIRTTKSTGNWLPYTDWLLLILASFQNTINSFTTA